MPNVQEVRPYIFNNPLHNTLPETNIAHENPIFPGKYHQNGGFSMAMLVYRRVRPYFSWGGVALGGIPLDSHDNLHLGGNPPQT